ncbi:hypothetical protein [Lentzea roselyniae]|uniref:hypothetical protein n=1 Tax=Lentzea roselyniae TaxID=531940 RepID=UPI0031F900EF
MKPVFSAFTAVVLSGLALTACTPTGQKDTPEVASRRAGASAARRGGARRVAEGL